MGESLERVQNKFACIIGELCNEPVVLSKFAIWLDLRLAEYKAKGAISLDCSGESPDPIWLKGHEKPQPIIYKSDNRSFRPANAASHEIHVFKYGSNPSQTQETQETGFDLNSDIMTDINERLSPEIVVVKEEVRDLEKIYPVGFHRHGNKTRKRPSTDIISTSTPKSQFIEDSITPVETGTQSLMSIIGETKDDNDELLSQPRGDNSMTFSPHTSAADPSYSQATVSAADDSSFSQNYSSFLPQPDQTFSPSQSQQSAGYMMGEATCDSQDIQQRMNERRSFYTKSVCARIKDKDSKSVNTIRHISSAVGQVQTWLFTVYQDTRPIENIPPKSLDEYLCQFFETVRTPSGKDYEQLTFSPLRSYIDRFLREIGYPHSISRSAEFRQSQYKFDQRRKQLKN